MLECVLSEKFYQSLKLLMRIIYARRSKENYIENQYLNHYLKHTLALKFALVYLINL